ncbi:MAG: hypothetical protein J6U05_05145 [Neisseriaceae bacterium]|nr:hypothetical protein [Neisseriaceae bacterium]
MTWNARANLISGSLKSIKNLSGSLNIDRDNCFRQPERIKNFSGSLKRNTEQIIYEKSAEYQFGTSRNR